MSSNFSPRDSSNSQYSMVFLHDYKLVVILIKSLAITIKLICIKIKYLAFKFIFAQKPKARTVKPDKKSNGRQN